jgi:hypothetical protein
MIQMKIDEKEKATKKERALGIEKMYEEAIKH